MADIAKLELAAKAIAVSSPKVRDYAILQAAVSKEHEARLAVIEKRLAALPTPTKLDDLAAAVKLLKG